MRVCYWSLIALLTLLFFPVAAWGVAMTSGSELMAAMPGSPLCGVTVDSDGPVMQALDPDQASRTGQQPDDRGPVPWNRDALPPTTATDTLVALRSEGQASQPLGRGTRLPYRAPQASSPVQARRPRLPQYA